MLTLSGAGVWRLSEQRGGGGEKHPPNFRSTFATFRPNFFLPTSYLAETKMSEQKNSQKVVCNMSNLSPILVRIFFFLLLPTGSPFTATSGQNRHNGRISIQLVRILTSMDRFPTNGWKSMHWTEIPPRRGLNSNQNVSEYLD